MYDPVTALLLVGTAVTAGGALYEGAQAKKQADYNAQVLEADAVAAKQKAAFDETLHRERVKRILSSQRAAAGASGVEFTGSPLLAFEETVRAGELDALAIRYGGAVESARKRSGAELSRMEGRAARTSSFFKAGATLLTGGARAYRSGKGK